MSNLTRARLRTKTGCLTCRQRRRKCNEKAPVCDGCTASSRVCRWPTSAELVDRRFASHDDSRHHLITPVSEAGGRDVLMRDLDDEAEMIPVQSPSAAALHPKTHLLAESAATHSVITDEMQHVLSRHFVQRYFSLLILPRCHPGFHDGWLTDIQLLMTSHKCLYFSVLACAASHIHLIDASTPCQALALTYYTNATRELSSLLNSASSLANHNGFLMSIILLYLHGCMGMGTYTDIPMHVHAATRVLTQRLLDRDKIIEHLFDRLAVESVLYQMFLVTTELWSHPPEQGYHFDAEFWLRAEELLDRSTFFPGRSTSFNSPVLGVPVSLFRLSLTLRQQYRVDKPPDTSILHQIRDEVEIYEALLLCEDTERQNEDSKLTSEEVYYRDARCLYTLIVSLLLEQLTRHDSGTPAPLPEPGDSWQVRRAIRLLRRYQHADGWCRSFIGNWPVYTLGLLVGSPRDRGVIRDDLQRRWDLTSFAQVSRFRRDLEGIWAGR